MPSPRPYKKLTERDKDVVVRELKRHATKGFRFRDSNDKTESRPPPGPRPSAPPNYTPADSAQDPAPMDSDLALVVERWADLPGSIRAGIVAVVKAHCNG